jgi:putative protease
VSVELLAPAGEFKTALSAFAAGADAVYCGLAEYSARAFAQNLTLDELKLLVRFAHANKKKVYVTFNTLVCEDEIEGALETLSRLAQIRPDALIVQDIGIASLCKKHFPELELHASTQMAVHNLEGVLQLKELGFKRVVLARELSLEEISSIVKRSGTMEIECFIHGALCYSISGLCLYGAMEKSRSGNRGRCPYCCRVAHEDAAGGKRLQFSMKDLRLDEDVLKLVDAGVKSLKIEGRMKSDFYVASAVKYYRQIISGADFGRLTKSDLETVFSRRTTKLYFDGAKNTSSTPIDPTSLGHLGAEIGVVKRVTKDREGLSWLRFHTSRALERHDGLQFGVCDENGKPLGLGIGEMRQAISRRNVFEVSAGTDVEVLLPEKDGEEPIASKLKPGVKIYCSASQAVRRMFPQQSIRPSDYIGDIALDVEVKLEKDRLCASAEYEGRKVEVSLSASLDAAKNPAKTEEGVRKAFLKLGESD